METLLESAVELRMLESHDSRRCSAGLRTTLAERNARTRLPESHLEPSEETVERAVAIRTSSALPATSSS